MDTNIIGRAAISRKGKGFLLENTSRLFLQVTSKIQVV